MAEFCPECWNKLSKRNDSVKEYILSDYPDLCEGCGEMKNVVIAERSNNECYEFGYFLFPFKLVWLVISLPYRIYRKIKKNK